MTSGEICRRRQILDHFGDDEPGRPTGRCCDVCEPDAALVAAANAPLKRAEAAAAQLEGAAPRRASTPPVDLDDFERMRAWRYERAEGKPAFMVASNAVLEDLLRAKPASTEALLEVRGIGPAFCEKHGESLLAELRALAKSAGERSAEPGGEQSTGGGRLASISPRADVAQLVEHFTRNEGVRGSSPRVGFDLMGGAHAFPIA